MKIIKELTKNNDGDHHSREERNSPFIVEFENLEEKEQVMNEKTQYFRNSNSNIGINNARKKLERQQRKNNNEGKVEPKGDEKTEPKACRYNDKCKRKDCKFRHFKRQSPEKDSQDPQEESDDSGDDTDVEN